MSLIHFDLAYKFWFTLSILFVYSNWAKRTAVITIAYLLYISVRWNRNFSKINSPHFGTQSRQPFASELQRIAYSAINLARRER